MPGCRRSQAQPTRLAGSEGSLGVGFALIPGERRPGADGQLVSARHPPHRQAGSSSVVGYSNSVEDAGPIIQHALAARGDLYNDLIVTGVFQTAQPITEFCRRAA